jgi:hypothetical protein
MQLPKIKLKSKTKTPLGSILTMLLFFILLWEGYIAFNFIYKNFLAQAPAVDDSNIVRLDTQEYRRTVDYLNNLNFFIPNYSQPSNTNPFK